MPTGSDAPSRSQVSKAGRILRHALASNELLNPDVLRDPLDILVAFRAAHAYPLQKATMGLRSMVATEHCQVEVSQRLKRIPTILDKIVREPTMALANMRDIGGCRAVLASVAEVRRVEARLKRNRPPDEYNDYISSPRPSGYRAVHITVLYDERRIEVQLRTRVMHEWAIAVESMSGRTGYDFKSGRGPAPVLDWFRAVSGAMATEEAGGTVEDNVLAAVTMLREAALPYLTGRRTT